MIFEQNQNYIYKPNLYYRRSFEKYKDDIIKMDSTGKYFKMIWEVDDDCIWCRQNSQFQFSAASMPFCENTEYSSLEDLITDMFLELM